MTTALRDFPQFDRLICVVTVKRRVGMIGKEEGEKEEERWIV